MLLDMSLDDQWFTLSMDRRKRKQDTQMHHFQFPRDDKQCITTQLGTIMTRIWPSVFDYSPGWDDVQSLMTMLSSVLSRLMMTSDDFLNKDTWSKWNQLDFIKEISIVARFYLDFISLNSNWQNENVIQIIFLLKFSSARHRTLEKNSSFSFLFNEENERPKEISFSSIEDLPILCDTSSFWKESPRKN